MASSTAELLIEERIENLKRPVWIGYPKAKEILAKLDELFHYPTMHRMPNLAIIGETNNGKTMLLNSFYRSHSPDDATLLTGEQNTELPILKMQSPPEPNENRLYSDILLRLFSSASTRESTESKLQRIKILLTNLNTKMIILDEFQNALAGTGNRLRRFLNAIKYLGNELQIPIVVAGTPETLNVLQADPQIKNRFEPVFLHKWEFDKEFLRLLATFEDRWLPLQQPSKLHQQKIAKHLYDECEGTIGELTKLLQLLAREAIRSGSEAITEDMVSHDHLKQLGWRSPSIRNSYY